MHPKDTTGYLWLAVVKVFDGTASGGGDCPVSVCKRAGALELQQILLHLAPILIDLPQPPQPPFWTYLSGPTSCSWVTTAVLGST
jgi:hypothetical protein